MNYKILNSITLISILLILGWIYWQNLSWCYLWIPMIGWLFIVLLVSANIRWNFFLKSVHKGKPAGRKIALTFDDGPHPVYTPRVLEILEKYHAKATFFCIGKNIQTHPEILKQTFKKGHCIGNHSFMHNKTIDFKGKNGWIKEIENTGLEILKITGKKPKFFRPPYGVTTPHLAEALKKSEYLSIGWSQRTYDTMLSDFNKINQKILKNIKSGDIILLHDRHENIIPILEQLLPELARKNFTFVTVNELIDEEPYC